MFWLYFIEGNFSMEINVKDLQIKSNQIRQEVVQMITGAKSGHIGGPLGLADIFTALYFHVLNHNPKMPDDESRDRLVLSNGHVCAVRYAAMALSGYFPQEELSTFRKWNSRLQGHPSIKFLSGLETSSGSLGQGLSLASGMAIAARLKKQNHRIYVSMSDGEFAEGMVWESIQSAVHYKLDNLVGFIDRNFIQIDGNTEQVMRLEPLGDKIRSFGWNVISADGHNFTEIIQAFEAAKNHKGSPTMIVFRTILGKDVSFMENNAAWHGNPPNNAQAEMALDELRKKY